MHQQRTTAMFSEHWLHCPWNGATVTLNVQVNLCICRRTPAKGQIFHLFKWRIRHHRKRTGSKVSKCRFSGKWWITVRPNKKIYVVLVTRPTLVFTPDPKLFFSSPELKAQVSYSDRPLSVVRLSVCPSVCPSVCKLLHFRLLLQNRWANFNQTWHKSSLGGGDSKLLKWRGLPFSKGR